MSKVSEKDRFRRAAQPVIFKLWKLQVSYNHPNRKYTGREVINVYWDLQHVASIFDRRIHIRLLRRFLTLPPYRR